MALTKTNATVLASTSVAAGGTKTSPSTTSSTLDCSAYYGGDVTWKITNGGSAPGAPLYMTFQVSHDGANFYDYCTAAGDTTASSINSGTFALDLPIVKLRVICYNNTTNAVTAEAIAQVVTAL